MTAGNETLMLPARLRSHPETASRGFTLVEVLVTLLIISVGMLGLAGLQGKGLRDNHSAQLRSQAVQRAEDLLDRLRANRAVALSGGYDIALGEVPVAPAYAGMVLEDLVAWKTMLAASFPSGDGSVETDENVCTVIVQWAEAVGNQTVTVAARL